MTYFVKLYGEFNFTPTERPERTTSECINAYLNASDIQEICEWKPHIHKFKNKAELDATQAAADPNRNGIFYELNGEYFHKEYRTILLLGQMPARTTVNAHTPTGTEKQAPQTFRVFLSSDQTVAEIQKQVNAQKAVEASAIKTALDANDPDIPRITPKGVWQPGETYNMFDLVKHPDNVKLQYVSIAAENTSTDVKSLKTHGLWCKLQ